MPRIEISWRAPENGPAGVSVDLIEEIMSLLDDEGVKFAVVHATDDAALGGPEPDQASSYTRALSRALKEVEERLAVFEAIDGPGLNQAPQAIRQIRQAVAWE